MWINTWKFWTFLSWSEVNERKALKDIHRKWLKWVVESAQKKYRNSILDVLNEELIPKIEWDSIAPLSEIWGIIESTLDKVMQRLWNKSARIKNILELKYKMFLFWLLNVFKRRWYDLNDEEKKIHNVENEMWESLYNILKNRGLTTFFMMSKAFWLLDRSRNIINKFPEEKELKILDVSYQDVRSWLDKWQSDDDSLDIQEEPNFYVEDIYYDTQDLELDRKLVDDTKRSLRIRTKTDENWWKKVYYTIKRKSPEKEWKKEKWTVVSLDEKKVEPRECFENEYEIFEPEFFEWFLEDIWLRISRSKKKKRRAFSIEFEFEHKWKKETVHAKLDIDDYENWIPEFLEIECDNEDAIPYIIRKLWIPESATILTCWSRWLFKYYKKLGLLEEEYTKYYTVDKMTWDVAWDNWDTWNCNHASIITKKRKKK